MIEKFGGDFLVELFIRRDNTICELENIHEAFFSNFEILFLSIIDIIHLSFQLASFYSYSFSLIVACLWHKLYKLFPREIKI